MDPQHLKAEYTRIQELRHDLKTCLLGLDKMIEKGHRNIKDENLKKIFIEYLQERVYLAEVMNDYEDELNQLYLMAVIMNVDVDGSLLLATHRFFYRTLTKMEERLECHDIFPVIFIAMWCIVLVAAVVWLSFQCLIC